MIKTEFVLIISKQYQADKWWEKREISIGGIVADSNKYHENYITDCKENY